MILGLLFLHRMGKKTDRMNRICYSRSTSSFFFFFFTLARMFSGVRARHGSACVSSQLLKDGSSNNKS